MFVIDPLCALQLALFLEAPERGPQGRAGRGWPREMGAEKRPLQRGKGPGFLPVSRPDRGERAWGAGGNTPECQWGLPEHQWGPAGAGLPSRDAALGCAAWSHGGRKVPPRQLHAADLSGKNARVRVTQKPLVTVTGPRKAWWRMPAQGVSARTP